MEYSKEQIEKAKNCKTIEEFKVLAKNEGLNLTEEEVKKYFKATRGGELNDDDLDKVAGGKGEEPMFVREHNVTCPFCNTNVNIKVTKYEKPGEVRFEWEPNRCSCGAIIQFDNDRTFTFRKDGEFRRIRVY